eukprot:358848-Chlamydomonas_euryale.AAC.5
MLDVPCRNKQFFSVVCSDDHQQQSQGQSYRERTHEGYACVERNMAEGTEQRAGHCPSATGSMKGRRFPRYQPHLQASVTNTRRAARILWPCRGQPCGLA